MFGLYLPSSLTIASGRWNLASGSGVSSSSKETSRTIVERNQQGWHQSDRFAQLFETTLDYICGVSATISEAPDVDEGDVWGGVATSGVEKVGPLLAGLGWNQSFASSHAASEISFHA